MTHSPDHHEHPDMREFFDARQPLMERIYRKGVGEYAAFLPDLARAFARTDGILRCIDERTPGGVHAAGSGILMSSNDIRDFVRKAGLQGITSHAECGAAGLAFDALPDVEKAKYPNSDAYGKAFAMELADETGVPYAGHIFIDEMAGPSGAHAARVSYYDGTGKFNWQGLAGELPQGFVISRANHFLDTNPVREAAISVRLALDDDHGFGQLITPENPFLLIAIEDPANASLGLARLMNELRKIEEANGGRVKIDGFVAPR